jgi:hypothetical protein
VNRVGGSNRVRRRGPLLAGARPFGFSTRIADLPENASIVADRIITLLKRLLPAGDRTLTIQHSHRTVAKAGSSAAAGSCDRSSDTSKESDVLFEKLTQTIESRIATHRTQIDEMVAQHDRAGHHRPYP